MKGTTEQENSARVPHPSYAKRDDKGVRETNGKKAVRDDKGVRETDGEKGARDHKGVREKNGKKAARDHKGVRETNGKKAVRDDKGVRETNREKTVRDNRGVRETNGKKAVRDDRVVRETNGDLRGSYQLSAADEQETDVELPASYQTTNSENGHTTRITTGSLSEHEETTQRGRTGVLSESSLSSALENGVQWTTGALPENYPSLVEKYTSCRWRLGYLMVFAFILVQSMLNSMSFALVCMTSPSGTDNQSLSEANDSSLWQNTTDKYGDVNAINTTNNYVETAEFDYSSETQGILISSVFYAGVISPLFGSFASRAVGPKRVIVASMTGGGMMTMLMPIAARTHVYLVILCRIVLGFCVNIIAAVSLDLWLYWAPELEKAQLVAYSYTGYNIANVITFSASGLLCLIPFDNGWPFIFYLFGGLTLLWCCMCQWMVYTRPEDHPTITEEEKHFILLNRSKVDKNVNQRRAIPWKSIFLTPGVWAYLLICFLHNFNTALLFSYIPSYMATALNFPIEENGFLSSLPYMTRVIANLLISYISLKLLKVLSVTHTRKFVQCTGFVMAAVVTSMLCVLKEGQSYEAVAILSLDTPFQAATVNAAIITPLDMAPQYAAIISSVGNVFSQGANTLSPLIASFILTERSREQWNTVFFMMSGLYVFGTVLFLVMGSGELQPWAYDVEVDIQKHNAKKTSHENEAYIADQDETSHM